MQHVTATKLREDLFSVLKKVSMGTVISIDWNGCEVGRIIPTKKHNWRDQIKIKGKIRGSVASVFKPLDADIWEGIL